MLKVLKFILEDFFLLYDTFYLNLILDATINFSKCCTCTVSVILKKTLTSKYSPITMATFLLNTINYTIESYCTYEGKFCVIYSFTFHSVNLGFLEIYIFIYLYIIYITIEVFYIAIYHLHYLYIVCI